MHSRIVWIVEGLVAVFPAAVDNGPSKNCGQNYISGERILSVFRTSYKQGLNKEKTLVKDCLAKKGFDVFGATEASFCYFSVAQIILRFMVALFATVVVHNPPLGFFFFFQDHVSCHLEQLWFFELSDSLLFFSFEEITKCKCHLGRLRKTHLGKYCSCPDVCGVMNQKMSACCPCFMWAGRPRSFWWVVEQKPTAASRRANFVDLNDSHWPALYLDFFNWRIFSTDTRNKFCHLVHGLTCLYSCHGRLMDWYLDIDWPAAALSQWINTIVFQINGRVPRAEVNTDQYWRIISYFRHFCETSISSEMRWCRKWFLSSCFFWVFIELLGCLRDGEQDCTRSGTEDWSLSVFVSV